MAAGIFGSHYAFGVEWTTAVLIASMYASHTLISYPVVSKFGLSNVPAAVIAVFGTIVAVLLSLLTLAQVVSVKINGGFDMAELWNHNRRYLQRTENQRAQQYHQKHYQKNCHRLL